MLNENIKLKDLGDIAKEKKDIAFREKDNSNYAIETEQLIRDYISDNNINENDNVDIDDIEEYLNDNIRSYTNTSCYTWDAYEGVSSNYEYVNDVIDNLGGLDCLYEENDGINELIYKAYCYAKEEYDRDEIADQLRITFNEIGE